MLIWSPTDYQQRVFQMVCGQHAADRASKQSDERKDQVAPSLLQMAA